MARQFFQDEVDDAKAVKSAKNGSSAHDDESNGAAEEEEALDEEDVEALDEEEGDGEEDLDEAEGEEGEGEIYWEGFLYPGYIVHFALNKIRRLFTN